MAYPQRPDQRYDHDKIDMKSAVISGAFEGLSKDEIDRFYTQSIESASKPKKGSFQITSVTSDSAVNRDDEDSQDDLDDTHTYTEDNMSMDWSKTTDLDPDRSPILEQEEPPHEEIVPRPQPKMPDFPPQAKERSSTDNQSRFRVVKIVTQEPFKRGRWTCLDYLPDPNKQPNPDYVNLDFREKDQFVVTGSETSSAASSIHYVHGQDDPAKNPLAPAQSVTQTLTSPVYFDGDQSKLQSVLNGGLDPLETSSVQPGVITPESFPSGVPLNGTALSYSTSAVHQPSLPPSTQQSIATSAPLTPLPPASLTQPMPTASLTQPMPPASLTQPLPVSSLTQPLPTPIPQPIPAPLSQPLPATLNQPLPATMAQPVQVMAPTIAPADSSVPSSMGHTVLSSSYQPRPQLPINGQYTAPSDVPSGTAPIDVSVSRAISVEKPSSRTHRISIGGEELELSDEFGKAGGLLEQIGAIRVPSSLASPTKETDGEDSGPSSVAIDNKIEQAMDLVKSHLMFAVREEVEVLKEQIQELEESKRKLEFENNFLKSLASPETLSKLAQAQQSQLPSNT